MKFYRLYVCVLAVMVLTLSEYRVRAQTAPPPGQPGIIQGLNIQGDYVLYGSKFDGVTLMNSTITGALKIDGVHNVTIKDNHLNSVWFRDNQPSDHVTIEHNEISGATEDCIHIHEGTARPSNVLIEENFIHNCGVAHPTSDLYHAIYDQVPGVIIRGNCISEARSALSIRSNAIIEDNVIENVPSGGAIEYYSDHDAEPGSKLIIKGNTISSKLRNAPDSAGSNRGLIILGNDIGKGKHPVSSIEVHDNKVAVLNTQDEQGGGHFSNIYVQANSQNVKVSHNTLVNLIPNGQFHPAVGSESNNEKTNDPQALSKIKAAARPACGIP